jgi:hypothetical protein
VRDEFTQATKDLTAKRAGWLCSNPDCRCATVGAAEGHDGVINAGVAAHITAASPDGPRYDSSLTSEQRRHHSNGIWLCQKDGKAVDSDEQHFTVETMRKWKRDAERRSFQAIVAPGAQRDQPVVAATIDAAVKVLINRLGLPEEDDIDTVAARLIAAAANDIAAFRRTAGWPRHAVALNLRMTDGENERAFQVSGLVAALDTFKEITIIAPPGTGKTTTLVQVADAIVQTGRSVPLFVPLGEWASQPATLLQSVLQRAAFQGIREQHFMLLAHHGRLVLLLDGWNELDREARLRASSEIKRLRRDFPSLGIVVSTRRQALDVPINGPVVQIDTLTDEQQLEIARALRGERGAALLDQAARTPGVRSLVSIPLYLTALLLQAPGGAMPTTKETVLRLFVAEHERGGERGEALHAMLSGHHAEVLTALAVEATRTANTAISDDRARLVVKQVEDRLVAAGQITAAPPAAVLDLFVDQHTLVRAGGAPAALSFQHQQFQEWYASFEVEQVMRKAALGDADALHRMRVDMLDQPAWEESILFACERASRDDPAGINAVAAAVATALPIDPILTAEMIYRAADGVWARVQDNMLAFVARWHTRGTVDRAVRFMITSGRPDFAEQIWPLVENADSQIHLSAMRAARRFRPSVLGPDARARLARLPQDARHNVLAELVLQGGPEGIELANAVARDDPSAKVQFAITEALLFRRAELIALDLLAVASPAVWPLLAAKGYADEIADPVTRERLREERERLFEREAAPLARVGWVLASPNPSEADKEQITAAIEAADFPARDQNASWQVQRAWERYPEQVTRGLVRRLEAGRDLPFHAREMLAATPAVDDGPIAAAATNLDAAAPFAHVAASVIGPRTAGALIDSLLALADQMVATCGPYDRAATERHGILTDRLRATRPTSFAPALLSRGQTDQLHRIGLLADLLAGHGTDESRRKPFAVEHHVRRELIGLVHRWADTLLWSPDSKRYQLAEVGRAIGRLAELELVDDLTRLLATDLERWRQLRERRSVAAAQMSIEERSDAAHCWTRQYREAFAAIGGSAVIGIMHGYLEDEDFGFDAGWVLKEIWDRRHNAPAPSPFKAWPDFATVAARRQERRDGAAPAAAAPPAGMIFAAIERMTAPGTSEKRQRVAIALGPIGLSMPHGNQSAAIDALLALPQPLRSKRELLAALVLDGEVISAELPLEAIREWLADARQKTWMHREGLWEVKEWLQLLPFSDRPAATIEGVDLVLGAIPHAQDLERVISALGEAPGEEAQRALQELMRRHPQMVFQQDWVRAIVKRGTRSAAIMLMDFAASGGAGRGGGAGDAHWMASELLGLIQRYPDLKAEVMRRYEAGGNGSGQAMFEYVLAELGDPEAVLTLVRAYAAVGRGFDGLLQRAIHEAALSKEPAADWVGACELHPVPLLELRKTFFAMMQHGSARAAALAEACLADIDGLRDEYGASEFEPRHPDVESGQPWPVVAARDET